MVNSGIFGLKLGMLTMLDNLGGYNTRRYLVFRDHWGSVGSQMNLSDILFQRHVCGETLVKDMALSVSTTWCDL